MKTAKTFFLFWHSPLGVCNAKCRLVSRVDDSEPRQLLHSGRGYWILGPGG